jgi:hypothetical protein
VCYSGRAKQPSGEPKLRPFEQFCVQIVKNVETRLLPYKRVEVQALPRWEEGQGCREGTGGGRGGGGLTAPGGG